MNPQDTLYAFAVNMDAPCHNCGQPGHQWRKCPKKVDHATVTKAQNEFRAVARASFQKDKTRVKAGLNFLDSYEESMQVQPELPEGDTDASDSEATNMEGDESDTVGATESD